MLILLSFRTSSCRFVVDKKAFWPSWFIPFCDKSSTCSRVQLARSWSESDEMRLSFKNRATVSLGRRSGAADRCRAEQSTAVPPFWCEQLHFTGHPVAVQQQTTHTELWASALELCANKRLFDKIDLERGERLSTKLIIALILLFFTCI